MVELFQTPQIFVNSLLPYKDETHWLSPLGSRTELILHKLIPAFKFKLGKGLVEQAFDRTRDLIRQSMREQSPIDLVASIGTSKWFDGTNINRNIAGLSELLMFEQMAHVNSRVSSVYKPGVRWVLLAEELTNEWLYSQINESEKIAMNNHVYLKSFQEMLKTASLSLEIKARLINESDIITGNNINKLDYIQLLKTNNKLFLNYLETILPLEEQFLRDHNRAEWDDNLWNEFFVCILPTAKAFLELVENGWNGGIHPFQRRYYMNQFEKTGGVKAIENVHIAAYFGSVLARRQMQFTTKAVGKPAIKVAFIRYPKGTSDKEKTAITISQHPLYGYGSSHKRISPWAASTNVERDKKGKMSLRVRPVREQEVQPLAEDTISYAGVDVPIYIYKKDNNE